MYAAHLYASMHLHDTRAKCKRHPTESSCPSLLLFVKAMWEEAKPRWGLAGTCTQLNAFPMCLFQQCAHLQGHKGGKAMKEWRTGMGTDGQGFQWGAVAGLRQLPPTCLWERCSLAATPPPPQLPSLQRSRNALSPLWLEPPPALADLMGSRAGHDIILRLLCNGVAAKSSVLLASHTKHLSRMWTFYCTPLIFAPSQRPCLAKHRHYAPLAHVLPSSSPVG